MALTLAIGFLVDDAIVFLENTVRLMEEGQSAFQASLQSAKEISFTILAMTLSLAAVFRKSAPGRRPMRRANSPMRFLELIPTKCTTQPAR
jgi:AcrB/AcrD/AcrF family